MTEPERGESSTPGDPPPDGHPPPEDSSSTDDDALSRTSPDPTDSAEAAEPSGDHPTGPPVTEQAVPAEPSTPLRRTRRQRLLGHIRRTLLHRAEPEAVDELPPPAESSHDRSTFALTRMGPFAIGFFGALGAMVAFTLVTIAAEIQSILVLVVLSFFLALGLNPVVEALRRRGLRRGFSVGLVALGVLIIIGLAAWAVVPVFSEQITNLVGSIPALMIQLRDTPQIAELDRRFGLIDRTTAFFSSQGLINTIFGGLLGAGRVLANAIFSFIVTLVLTLYFLASLPTIKESLYRLAPRSKRPRVRYLANEMFRRIGGYLSGMFLVVTTAGTCAFAFMLVIGLARYALALAVMVALFAFIPLIGSTLSMIVVSLVALTAVGPFATIATICYFLVYQQFEAYVIQPRVMKRQVDVPGAVVIVVALAGGALLGIIGALIAIPTAAALLLLYREVLLPRLDRS